MKLYCGIDLHSSNSVIAVLDEQDKAVYEKRLDNDLDDILEALNPFKDEIVGCMVESTYKWYWLVDGLMEAGYRVHLAHPGALPQYAGLKFTNDSAIWNPRIKQYYQRKQAKAHVLVAKKAVANKLARACYHMLKRDEPFDVKRAFG